MTALIVSEARVEFAPLQQATSQDVKAVGTLGQASVDNVVENILYSGAGYTDMSVAISGVAGLTVQPGYLIQDGLGYSLRDSFHVDLAPQIALVPDSTKTLVVLILADGDESVTGETRTFLDASKKPNNAADPWPTTTLATNTRSVRSVIISKVAGTADVQPQDPTFNAALCPIAKAVVSNTAVVSVTQLTDQRITRLDQIVAFVQDLLAFEDQVSPQIDTILSALSALALKENADVAAIRAELAALRALILALSTQTSAPVAAILRDSDLFLNALKSNPSATGYNCKTGQGLQFPTAASTDVAGARIGITVQNPYASNIKIASSKLMPAYGLQWAVANVPNSPNGSLTVTGAAKVSLQVNNYAGWTAALKQRGLAVWRTRWSALLQAVSASALTVGGDPSSIFAIDPTDLVYDTSWGNWNVGTTEFIRRAGYWRDLSSRHYWTPVVASGNTGGLSVINQVFRPSASLMVTSVSLLSDPFGRAANSAATVRLVVLGDLNGFPDPTNVYADVSTTGTAQIGLLDNSANQQFFNFVMPYPLLARGGQALHFSFMTTSAVVLSALKFSSSTAPSPAALTGVLAYANGGWTPLQNVDALQMVVYAAAFGQADRGGPGAVRVPLQAITLAGGIDNLDIVTPGIIPDGCSINFEVTIGGATYPLAEVASGSHPLAGRPDTLPLTMILSGTPSLAPIIDLTAVKVRASRAGTALKHVSSVQTPTANVTTIHKSVIVDNWSSSYATLTAALLTGSGYATSTAPTTGPVDAIQSDGSLLRSWTWVLGTSVPSFEMELDGSLTDVTKAFTVRQSNWDAST